MALFLFRKGGSVKVLRFSLKSEYFTELFSYLCFMMVTNELFRQCLSAIPQEQRAEFDLSYGIAERLDAVLKKKGITQHELACRLGKRDSEVSKWLTGRHNFTTSTIARIEQAIGDKLIQISK